MKTKFITEAEIKGKISQELLGKNIKEFGKINIKNSKLKNTLFLYEGAGTQIQVPDKERENLIFFKDSKKTLNLSIEKLIDQGRGIQDKDKNKNFLIGSIFIGLDIIVFLTILNDINTIYHGKGEYYICKNPSPTKILIKRIF